MQRKAFHERVLDEILHERLACRRGRRNLRSVKRISMPNYSSKSPQRRLLERKRWFREAQRWRTGCEGRISLLKRRHGLNRCRYRGEDGMRRWVGLGVIADNLINIGLTLNAAAAE